MIKRYVLLSFLFVSVYFITSCSNSSVNPLIGDFKNSDCTGSGCSSSKVVSDPPFERETGAEVIVSQFDNSVELNGKCNIKDYPDSEIIVSYVGVDGSTKTRITSGIVPLIGITSYGSQIPTPKCEKGKWGFVLNSCANGLGAIGSHQIELTLKGKSAAGVSTEIADGVIRVIVSRSASCLYPNGY